MSLRSDSEIAWLMDDNATDDRCVFAVIDGSVTVGDLKKKIERLEDEAEDRGFHRGYAEARRQFGPVIL